MITPWPRRLPGYVKRSRSDAAVLGENFTDSGHIVLELLNRVGADGWELADREEREERADGPSYWDPNRTVTIYTFNNPVTG